MTAADLPVSGALQSGPPPSRFERVPCYYCQATASAAFLTAQDISPAARDIHLYHLRACGLHYQNPRLGLEHVKAFYDHEYIAHRKRQTGARSRVFFFF